MVRFLIIRFSSIGDIVLTTPVIRCLKSQVEDAEIHFLTKKRFESVLSENPYIDRLWLFDDDLNQISGELKKFPIDYIIDLHHNLRSARLKRKLNLAAFSFNKINLEKWLIVHFKINKLPSEHIVDRYLETTKLFDVTNDGKGLDYFISEKDHQLPEEISKKLPKKFIALVIGAQHFTKKMSPEHLAKLCDKLNKTIVILGGSEDQPAAKEILNKSKDADIIDTTGKLSLNQSAYIVKTADVVITHDTGLMHIAAAYKKRILSVWGNTIPEFGMYPYQPDPQSMIFEVENLPCRPCSKIGFMKCPKNHFKCMNDQDIEAIAKSANLEIKE